LIATAAELNTIGSSTLFSDYVSQDDKNSDVMSYKLSQGGIGLPEREYYFKNDTATQNIRKQYVYYITRILSLSGEDSIKASASQKV
jgi:putative endopeptidase